MISTVMAHEAKHITSLANETVKFLKSQSLKKNRDSSGLFIVEGLRHATEAVAAGMTLNTLVYSERAKADIADLLKASSAAIETSDDILCKITGRDNTQPVVCAFEQKFASPDDAMQGLWVLLEDIRDPGNLGTIMRTCDATGAKGVILVGNTCDPFSPEAVRATMGSFARIGVLELPLADFLTWRTEYKGKVIGTHLRTKTDYREADYKGNVILAMGSEQAGLSDALADACDTLVKIPMTGGAESLNLGVATGVMLYQIYKG